MLFQTAGFESDVDSMIADLGETATGKRQTTTLPLDSAGEVDQTESNWVTRITSTTMVIRPVETRQGRDDATVSIGGVLFPVARVALAAGGEGWAVNDRVYPASGGHFWVMRVDPFDGHDRLKLGDKGPREP